MRSKRRKPKLDPSPTVFVVDKYKAAIGQLESAILLWFNEADPISILVLASNSLDCYHAIGKSKGKPSWLKERMEEWPPELQERITYVQDFAKHGGMDFGESTPHETNSAPALIPCFDWMSQESVRQLDSVNDAILDACSYGISEMDARA